MVSITYGTTRELNLLEARVAFLPRRLLDLGWCLKVTCVSVEAWNLELLPQSIESKITYSVSVFGVTSEVTFTALGSSCVCLQFLTIKFMMLLASLLLYSRSFLRFSCFFTTTRNECLLSLFKGYQLHLSLVSYLLIEWLLIWRLFLCFPQEVVKKEASEESSQEKKLCRFKRSFFPLTIKTRLKRVKSIDWNKIFRCLSSSMFMRLLELRLFQFLRKGQEKAILLNSQLEFIRRSRTLNSSLKFYRIHISENHLIRETKKKVLMWNFEKL